MLFDFNEAWTRVSEAQYDVCICGTGPAGITTARKLAARGKKVLLLEAGGLNFSDVSQDHYRGTNVGHTVWLETSRLRYLGGSSNHWAGLCALLDPITFEAHNTNGLPGWPISYEEVISNLDEAKEILDIAGKDLSRSKQPGFASPLFDRYGFAESAPTRFFEKYGSELRQSPHIDVFYNANLVDITLTDDLARVKNFRIRNYNGQVSDVSTNQFVLALGGIENPRILLNADHQVSPGVGNHSGMVGRCFMESLNVPIGRFVVTDPEFWKAVGAVPLIPTEAFLRHHRIENGEIGFYPSYVITAYGRLRVVKEFIQETGCYWPSLTAVARQFVDFNCPGDGVIDSIIEQEPNPASRISLAKETDSFGLRRVQMDWQISAGDAKTIRVLSFETAKEMARLDIARVQLARFIVDSNLQIPVSGFGHHMGTTRMSADRRHGVVNENCQVHGINNLYIAGSSVFSKCGGRNPTLTIVLLSLRLGEFLSKLN